MFTLGVTHATNPPITQTIIWISKNPLWQCKVGDVIQYQHKRDTTTYKDSPKFVNWKKLKKVEQPMHGNYKPNNNYEKITT